MAVLYISEYAFPNTTVSLNAGVAGEPSADQTVAITAGSLQSTAFKGNTQMVRVHTDAICSVAFGTNPTATATTKRLAANSTEYFTVPSGQAYKVAVITNT